jgi:hypothetical protein
MKSSRFSIEQFTAADDRINRTTVLLVLLFVAALPVNAEDICSGEGKSRMSSADVSEAQIARICPAKIEQSITSAPFIDIDELIIDMDMSAFIRNLNP